MLNRKVEENQKSLYVGMGMSYFKKYKRVRLAEEGSSDEVRYNQARIFQFLKQPEKANDIYKELTASNEPDVRQRAVFNQAQMLRGKIDAKPEIGQAGSMLSMQPLGETILRNRVEKLWKVQQLMHMKEI